MPGSTPAVRFRLQPKRDMTRQIAMDDRSDEALIRAVIAGELRAFETLVRRHQDMVARFVWRIVRVEEDREEVCQDVFLKVYRNLAHFKFDSKFTTWLYSIAYRTAVSHTRGRRARTEPLTGEEPDGRSMEGEVVAGQISRYVARAIGALSVDERSIVTLFHVQGCGVEEIGEIMSKPVGTIKSILFRARKKMKDGLAPLVHSLEETGSDYD